MHITGTKGKGSTSAFVERICRGKIAEAAKSTNASNAEDEASWTGGVGLYTSPHLCSVTERIRINGRPIPEAMFTKYFFQIWDRLSTESHALEPIPDPHVPEGHLSTIPEKPVYFRFLTLLCFHIFLQLQVKLTVLEVGMGGTYDATNAVPKPLVTGITALGLDHTYVLGNTVEEIARTKGGIYKAGVPALMVAQEGPAKRTESVLRDRAQELEASSFEIVPINPALDDVKLGMYLTIIVRGHRWLTIVSVLSDRPAWTPPSHQCFPRHQNVSNGLYFIRSATQPRCLQGNPFRPPCTRLYQVAGTDTVAGSMSNRDRPHLDRLEKDNMVPRWCPHLRLAYLMRRVGVWSRCNGHQRPSTYG